MILMENKNTIHFKHKLLPNHLPHDLEIVTVNRGESTSQYHTPLAVAKFTGRWKIIKFGYFTATSHMWGHCTCCTCQVDAYGTTALVVCDVGVHWQLSEKVLREVACFLLLDVWTYNCNNNCYHRTVFQYLN
jgi:hypothetical protein